MARIRMGQKRVNKTWREFIVDQIKVGKVVPIIGNTVANNVLLGGHDAMVKEFAAYLKYPGSDDADLAQITQFVSVSDESPDGEDAIKSDYLNWVKSRLFSIAEETRVSGDLLEEADARFDEMGFGGLCNSLGFPRFGDPRSDPMLVLAQMPLPIYLTTSYHGLLEAALIKAGKQPQTATCNWSALGARNDNMAEDYRPTPEQPLVFHLHGHDSEPHSLVLTENNYMAFLVAVARDIGRETDLIPARVRHALADSSLIMMGFEPDSWDFRTLLWGLLQPRPRKQTSVTILQVKPSRSRENYLRHLMHSAALEIYWGDPGQFTGELMSDLGYL